VTKMMLSRECNAQRLDICAIRVEDWCV